MGCGRVLGCAEAAAPPSPAPDRSSGRLRPPVFAPLPVPPPPAARQVANPFQFRHVTHLKSARQFDDVGACVVLATPSMLQSGASRELFEAWCEDARNACIIADFAVAGTLAREVLSSPAEITTRAGAKVRRGVGCAVRCCAALCGAREICQVCVA